MANVHWEFKGDRQLEPNDSWQNTNEQFDEDYARRVVDTTFREVFYFYGTCGLIFGTVYMVGKWLLK